MYKKIFWKFNIIDILLLIILTISIIALIYKLTWGKSSGETHEYTFTYVCTTAPRELTENLQIGAPCADGDTGTDLGTLSFSETEVLPAQIPAPTATRNSRNEDENVSSTATPTTAPTQAPDTVKLILRSELEGRSVEHGVEIEDALYLKGKTIHLIVDQTIFDVYIADIKQYEKD